MPTKNTPLRRRSKKVHRNKSTKRSRRTGPKRSTKRSRRTRSKRSTKRSRRTRSKRYSRKKRQDGGSAREPPPSLFSNSRLGVDRIEELRLKNMMNRMDRATAARERGRSPSPDRYPPVGQAEEFARFLGDTGRRMIDATSFVMRPATAAATTAATVANKGWDAASNYIWERNYSADPNRIKMMDEQIAEEYAKKHPPNQLPSGIVNLKSPKRIDDLMKNGGLWQQYQLYIGALEKQKRLDENPDTQDIIEDIISSIRNSYKELFEARNAWLENKGNVQAERNFMKAAENMKKIDEDIKRIYLEKGAVSESEERERAREQEKNRRLGLIRTR